jgi:hypothetical protein
MGGGSGGRACRIEMSATAASTLETFFWFWFRQLQESGYNRQLKDRDGTNGPKIPILWIPLVQRILCPRIAERDWGLYPISSKRILKKERYSTATQNRTGVLYPSGPITAGAKLLKLI